MGHFFVVWRTETNLIAYTQTELSSDDCVSGNNIPIEVSFLTLVRA